MSTPAPRPRIRLDKKEAKKGDLVEVKALVAHIMESGQRKDKDGNVIPRKIINKFTCEVNGKLVFPPTSSRPCRQIRTCSSNSGPRSPARWC